MDEMGDKYEQHLRRQFSGAPLASYGKRCTRLPRDRPSRCASGPGSQGIVHPASVRVFRRSYKTKHSKHHLPRLGATGIHPSRVSARWVSDPTRAWACPPYRP